MHTTMLLLLFVLFVDGVSGADPDETLSVMEGDSVTLHTGLTEILNDDTIVWMFVPNSSLISQITRKKNVTSFFVTDDVGFRGRLQVDQNTGSLTIRNTRERHSGQYEVAISRRKTTYKTFNVTVHRVASGTGGVKSVSVSVMEGKTVTLNPDKTQIHGDDLVLWRFGDILLAKIDVENKQISLNDADEGYRDRLQLNQTGSLNITNTKTTDSGLYHLQIRGSESSQQFILTVSQPGLSPGAVAGIVAAVAVAAAAVAAAGFIYQRRKISELQKQTLTGTEGEDVILKPNNTIQKGDVILWMFEYEKQLIRIAKFIRETGEIVIYDYAAGERFRDRLDLDKTTGSLTIRKSRPAHSGLYTLYITSSSGDSEQRFIVTVSENVEVKSVEEGDTVTLNPDTKIQGIDQKQWMFGDQDRLIAEIRGGTGEICIYYDDDAANGRFRGRLKLEKTGSLTITNIKPEHTGLYKLQTFTSTTKGILCKRFRVSIPLSPVPVIAGESVHLSTDRPKIETDDEIQWKFGGEIIAEVKEGTGKTHDGAAGRFRDRLQLDKRTGDLTIKNFTAEDAGDYKLKISNSKGDTNMIYAVTIRGKRVLVTEGESVHLSTDRPKIERDDVIQWRCGDEIIAEIKGGTGKTHDGADGRFRDRLQLDKRTGDLTIKNSTDEDEGDYKLKIRSSKGNTNWTYSVGVIFAIKPRKELPVKGNNGKRVDKSASVVIPLLNK